LLDYNINCFKESLEKIFKEPLNEWVELLTNM
jgi:hypothetical protein